MAGQGIFMAWIGGSLIGLAATLLMLFNGRIAGISGITKGLLVARPRDWGWRLAFLGGLLCGGLVLLQLGGMQVFAAGTSRPLVVVALAGFLVGFGTVLANGCTSGHGVCGVSRLSRRSIVATLCFMATGFITVAVYRAATA